MASPAAADAVVCTAAAPAVGAQSSSTSSSGHHHRHPSHRRRSSTRRRPTPASALAADDDTTTTTTSVINSRRRRRSSSLNDDDEEDTRLSPMSHGLPSPTSSCATSPSSSSSYAAPQCTSTHHRSHVAATRHTARPLFVLLGVILTLVIALSTSPQESFVLASEKAQPRRPPAQQMNPQELHWGIVPSEPMLASSLRGAQRDSRYASLRQSSFRSNKARSDELAAAIAAAAIDEEHAADAGAFSVKEPEAVVASSPARDDDDATDEDEFEADGLAAESAPSHKRAASFRYVDLSVRSVQDQDAAADDDDAVDDDEYYYEVEADAEDGDALVDEEELAVDDFEEESAAEVDDLTEDDDVVDNDYAEEDEAADDEDLVDDDEALDEDSGDDETLIEYDGAAEQDYFGSSTGSGGASVSAEIDEATDEDELRADKAAYDTPYVAGGVDGDSGFDLGAGGNGAFRDDDVADFEAFEESAAAYEDGSYVDIDEFEAQMADPDLIDGTTPENYQKIPDPQVRKLTPFKIVASIYLLSVGVMLLFFGHRLFKPVLYVSGMNFTILVTLAIVHGKKVLMAFPNSVSNRTGNYYNDSVYFFTSLATGLVGGLLFTCFWRAGVFTVGASLGYTLSTFVLSLVSNGTISSSVGRGAFIISIVLAFGIAILFFEKHLLILSTALPGALAVALGVDVYTQCGVVDAHRSFISGAGGFETNPKYWGVLASFVVLAVVGCGVQAIMAARLKRRAANASAGGAGGAAAVSGYADDVEKDGSGAGAGAARPSSEVFVIGGGGRDGDEATGLLAADQQQPVGEAEGGAGGGLVRK
ncbi:hypothetical protein DFJ73DRAFT_757792 [Zopfochytrium polystomum]|nr:hypothetical protein DFJ73DRAFT_757792 [Zopfochytrium polystomum]